MGKKVIYIIVVVFSMAFRTQGQSRENRETLLFADYSEKIMKANGWKYNQNTGKWIVNKNILDTEKTPATWVSHIEQNFNWIQFRSFVLEGKKYYALVWDSEYGTYKYPSLELEWEKERNMCFFIFDSTQFEELKAKVSLKNGEEHIFKSLFYGKITDKYKILGAEHAYTEENLLNAIWASMQNSKSTDFCFSVNSQIDSQKQIVRFKLPELCLTREGLANDYFELEMEEFEKLMNF